MNLFASMEVIPMTNAVIYGIVIIGIVTMYVTHRVCASREEVAKSEEKIYGNEKRDFGLDSEYQSWDEAKKEIEKAVKKSDERTVRVAQDEVKRILREMQLERELADAKKAVEANPIVQAVRQTEKEMAEKKEKHETT